MEPDKKNNKSFCDDAIGEEDAASIGPHQVVDDLRHSPEPADEAQDSFSSTNAKQPPGQPSGSSEPDSMPRTDGSLIGLGEGRNGVDSSAPFCLAAVEATTAPASRNIQAAQCIEVESAPCDSGGSRTYEQEDRQTQSLQIDRAHSVLKIAVQAPIEEPEEGQDHSLPAFRDFPIEPAEGQETSLAPHAITQDPLYGSSFHPGAPGAPQGHIYGSAKVELAFKKTALEGKLEERQGEKSCDYDLIFDRARDPSAAPVLSLASQGSQASITNQHDTFGGEGQAIPGFKGYPRSPGDSTSSGMKKEQHGNEPCEGPPRSPRDPPHCGAPRAPHPQATPFGLHEADNRAENDALAILPERWEHIVNQCFSSNPADITVMTPSLDTIAGYLPIDKAALRQQSIRIQIEDFRNTCAKSPLAVIILQTLVILQMRCSELLPQDLLAELTTSIINHSTETPGDRHALYKCCNALAFAIPSNPLLRRERFSALQPVGKRRRGRVPNT